MIETSYENRRHEIARYFDETAVDAWKRLTSEAPVSRIRATVRAGRAQTLNTILSNLPEDLGDTKILDAGCGTGALAIELAKRGAEVTAIDLSPKLVELARQRAATSQLIGEITFHSGDMLNGAHGEFDYVVAMDSLIHYEPVDAINALARLAAQTRRGMAFTFAPRTPMLSLMHRAGKFFPKKDRSPAIVPISVAHMHREIDQSVALASWQRGSDYRIDSGFYKTHVQVLNRQ
jgi:magnesium-protoporphyrin O-methyltransferase